MMQHCSSQTDQVLAHSTAHLAATNLEMHAADVTHPQLRPRSPPGEGTQLSHLSRNRKTGRVCHLAAAYRLATSSQLITLKNAST